MDSGSRSRATSWRLRHPERASVYMVVTAVAVAAVALLDGGYDVLTRHWLALATWSAVGVLALVGPLPRRPRGWALALFAGLAGLTLITAAALAWTSSAERTVEELARVSGYAGVVTLVYLLVDRRRRKPVATGLLVGGLLVCALAVCAALFPAGFDDAVTRGRLAYPFGYTNALAAWSVITILMALAWSVEQRGRAMRGAALAGAVIATVALILSYSRGGLLVAVAGAGLLVLLAGHRRRAAAHILATAALAAAAAAAIDGAGFGAGSDPALILAVAALVAALALAFTCARLTAGATFARGDRPGRSDLARLVPAGLVLLVVAAIAGYGLLGGGGTAVVPGSGPDRLLSTDGQRPDLWDSALDAFAGEPVAGIGAGTFIFWWAETGDGPPVLDAHSLYLEQLAELGPAGLLFTGMLVLGLLGVALGPLRAGSGSAESLAMPVAVFAFAMFAGVDWLWESTAVTVLALVCGSLAARSTRSPSPASRRGTSSGAVSVPRVAICGLAVAVLAIQLPGLVSALRLRAAERAVADGDLIAAAERAGGAIGATPWAATPYRVRGEIELTRERPAAARADAEEAIVREPLNYRAWLLAFRADVELGNAADSLAAYRRARELGYTPRFRPPGRP